MKTRTAWERFQFEGERGDGALQVRSEILTSWRRSRLSGVDPSRLSLPHSDIDPDTRFARAARPVLEAATDEMADSGLCLAITDRNGRVLWSWAPNATLRRGLDDLELHRGFCFDEEIAGTNGLGTALETGRPVTISGEEHFKEPFHSFSCVAAPVYHPVTARAVGAVNITCQVGDTHPVLTTTVVTLVREVREALLAASGERERRLLDAFLATNARRGTAVATLSADVLITNDAAAELRLDHRQIWARVLEAAPDDEMIEVPGLDGRTAKLRLLVEQRKTTGAILLLDPVPQPPPTTGGAGPLTIPTASEHLTKALDRSVDINGAAMLRGEAGTGKRTAARRAFERGGREAPVVLDPAEITVTSFGAWCTELAAARSSTAPVLLTRINALSVEQALTVAALLARTESSAPLVATWDAGSTEAVPAHLSTLMDSLGGAVIEVLPLRRRLNELRSLIRVLVDAARHPVPQAVQLLEEHHWPGNVAELANVLHSASIAAGPGPIRPDHLPTYLRTGRTLTPLEQAEAAVIAEVLASTRGNKTEAAKQLGIARPTLYAKIRAYRL
ncbi:hypothetical protein LWC35_12665 [Pseudonocardia kujensis]|uniref:sigma-54-dependent Fis family transcriptional regulator n=1 Tax=Pseudonocardia kujensis TaxID=1128675 RepID=UPI001E519447|nr:helix-turn-helix domain-containing protein [Pseudonocardia kujensis]MCE0763753.1 hypothetical protein [Pseudonocardia kujensis]